MEGTTFGPYEIVELLGKGGMGEVYRARDPRLDREVAVKVLPAEFTDDRDRLERFEREARAAAALNHPNIAAVFDIGVEGGTRYFVEEYLSGSDLRQRLERSAIPLGRSLRLAIGIARGLAAAHRADVVHRDLKPENVFLTEDGPKIVDFGLAKITQVTGVGGDVQPDAPTQLQTATGMVMGTPGYMAPEQVEGRPVDQRSDLFAFGCLLYEMVSGGRAFQGESANQTMHRIVHEQTRPLDQIAAVPPELQRIVGKCLAKDPRRRYQSAAELIIDLEVLGAQVDSGEAVALPRRPDSTEPGSASRGPSAAVVGGLLAVATLVGLVVGWWAGGDRPSPVVASHVNLVERVVPRNDPGLAISPDGRTVVFVGADAAGEEGLFIRSLDAPDSRVVPGTSQAHSPTFSPDGRWVAYYDDEDRSLRKVDVGTGEIRVLSTVTGGHTGATWTDDGAVVFALFEGGLGRLASEDSEPELLAAPANSSAGELFVFPRFLPGSGDVLVTIAASTAELGSDRNSIGIVDGATGNVTTLLETASDGRYLHPDRLLFRRQDALYVVRFDPTSRKLIGEPAVLMRGVAGTAEGPLVYDVSRTGSLVLLRAQEYPVRDERAVVAVDRAGSETPLINAPRPYEALRVSPDGNRLAVQIGDPGVMITQVWLYDLVAETGAPLAAGDTSHPVWSRDGRWVAVSFGWGVVMHRSDLSGERRETDIVPGIAAPVPMGFGIDDRTLVVQSLSRGDATWMVGLEGEASAELVAEGRVQLGAAPSPDERWLAYTTLESGRPQVFVHEISTGRRWPISNERGQLPRWRADGGELFYWRDNGLYTVKVRADDSGWSSDPPELLFEGEYKSDSSGRWTAYDVAPDGQRFYLIRDDGPPGWQPTRLELILDASSLVEQALSAAR